VRAELSISSWPNQTEIESLRGGGLGRARGLELPITAAPAS
jgi:hypothetical protein